MKRLSYLFTCLATVAVFLIGCERHPASETVPGYKDHEAKKEAVEQDKMHTPVGSGSSAPSYFPSKGS